MPESSEVEEPSSGAADGRGAAVTGLISRPRSMSDSWRAMQLQQAWDWIKAKPARMIVFVVGTMLLLVALIPTVITWAPHWLASTGGLNANQRAQEVGQVRTALLALLAGGIAVVGAIYTARTFALGRQGHELNRQGQITERFTRAVDQLGSDKLDVRLGGIYALERLAHESYDDLGPIAEILTAYVREHARQPAHAEVPPAGAQQASAFKPTAPKLRTSEEMAVSGGPATDVQAVVVVLGRIRRQQREFDTNPRLDLEEAVLNGANLRGANLERANLRGANLERANLRGANLEQANLREANLEQAYLRGTNLTRADLTGANLTAANLIEADLTEAELTKVNLSGAELVTAKLTRVRLPDAVLAGANLAGAYLTGAELGGADLRRATLSGARFNGASLHSVRLDQAYLVVANFTEADLTGANLSRANLREAKLDKAKLDETDLREADLRDTDLQETSLRSAYYDDGTKWPEGFDPNAHGAVKARVALLAQDD